MRKSFREDAFDTRYLLLTEYSEVNVFNDPGISGIPSSPDHSHQAFDDGLDLTPYLQGDWVNYDNNKPCKLYKAGNHLVVDGQVKNASSFGGTEILFSFTSADVPLYVPGFVVSSQAGISEQPLDTTYFPVTVSTFIGASSFDIRIATPTSHNPSARLTINGFSYRSDVSSTTELPPDGRDLFIWDGQTYQGWDTGVWA